MTAEPDAAEVIALELALLRPDRRADRAFLEAVLHPQFTEFGTSGRQWRRDQLIEALLAEASLAETAFEPPEVTELTAHRLAADAILLTYRTPGARRSSVWLRLAEGWRLRFHQGTAVDSPLS
jgi:ribonuclease HI